MRISTIVMIGFAVLFGLLAVFIAQSWLNSQAEMRMRNLEANKKPVATQTIVVASKPLRFGAELGASSLREIRLAGGRRAGRRIRKDFRPDVVRPPRRADRHRGERADPVVEDHRSGPARDAVGGDRATGCAPSPFASTTSTASPASCCRATASMSRSRARPTRTTPTTSSFRTSRCWRSIRSPTSAPTSRRSRAL